MLPNPWGGKLNYVIGAPATLWRTKEGEGGKIKRVGERVLTLVVVKVNKIVSR